MIAFIKELSPDTIYIRYMQIQLPAVKHECFTQDLRGSDDGV
jgi:hypothetical protein